MSTLKVDAIRHNSATSDAITTSSDGTCTARITGMTGGGGLSHRNIIINGAMNVAQRGVSSTSTGFGSVDRFQISYSGTDEAPTQAQASVASGTTPYSLGFRKSFKITNGNQTSGAGATDHIQTIYTIEDQDLATSGWNYTSSSSYVTLSFYIKSSIAQNFYFYLQSDNGSQYRYVMETGSLSADTWTKVTKTISGNSNIVLNSDNGVGMYLVYSLFDGTDRTGTRPLNAWAALDNTSRTPDQTSTWYTTNDSTWEITGVQLEVGDTATSFEHRSYAEELSRCQRYYVIFGGGYNTGARGGSGGSLALYNYHLPVPLRAAPSFLPNDGSLSGFSNRAYKYNGFSDSSNTPILGTGGFTTNCSFVYVQQTGHSIDDDRVSAIQQSGGIALSAEL